MPPWSSAGKKSGRKRALRGRVDVEIVNLTEVRSRLSEAAALVRGHGEDVMTAGSRGRSFRSRNYSFKPSPLHPLPAGEGVSRSVPRHDLNSVGRCSPDAGPLRSNGRVKVIGVSSVALTLPKLRLGPFPSPRWERSSRGEEKRLSAWRKCRAGSASASRGHRPASIAAGRVPTDGERHARRWSWRAGRRRFA